MNGTGDDQAKQNHADITGQVPRVTGPFLFYRLSCDFTLRLTSLLCHLAFLWGFANRRNWRGQRDKMRERTFASSSLLPVNTPPTSSSCRHHRFVAPPASGYLA